MAITGKLMTADELWRLPNDGQRHELVQGALRTMPPSGGEHGWVMLKVGGPLLQYVEIHQIGLVYGGEVGFVLAENPDTVLAPDVAFVRRDRLAGMGDMRRFLRGAPDLAVEVISPSDLYTEVDEKVAAWLEYGVQMVLVVNPRRRVVAVHRPGRPPRVLTETDALDGEDVVPGWTLPVRAIFQSGLTA